MIKGLPERIKECRIRFGYSQKQLADKLGLSPSVISGYETGERTPSLETLLSFSYLFNCSTDYLLGKQRSETGIELNVDELSESQLSAIITIINSLKNSKDN